MNYDKYTFRIAFGQRLISLILFVFIGLIVAGFISILMGKILDNPTATMRITATMQDLIAFTLPAIAMALLSTKQPATFLSVNKKVGVWSILLTIGVLAISIPAMNYLITWNESVRFPESLAPLEQWMKTSEEAALQNIETLLGGTSVADLIMSILIVGIMTGFAEEILFRGALLKLIATANKKINIHFSIWTTAFLFSAIHMQFYGFFPRLLLGAFFGYLLWWSGSLWLPIIAHAFNNIVTVTFTWLIKRGSIDFDPNSLGATDDTIIMAVTSFIVTAIAIVVLRKFIVRSNQISCGGTQNHDQGTSL